MGGADPTTNVDANGNIDPTAKDLWLVPNQSATAGTLQFSSDIAKACVQQCNTAIGWVYAAQERVQAMASLTPFNQLPSGQTLPVMFNSALGELSTALSDHQTVLSEMADTFIKAGKTYDIADDHSASHIQQVNSDWSRYDTVTTSAPNSDTVTPAPTTLSSSLDTIDQAYEHPLPAFLETPGLSTNPNLLSPSFSLLTKNYGVPSQLTEPQILSGYSGDKANVQSQLEPLAGPNLDVLGSDPPVNSMHYDLLYGIGKAAEPAVKQVYQASQDWQTLSDTLTSNIGSFVTSLIGASTSWNGTGKTQAISAANNYQKQLTALTNRIDVVSGNLAFVSDWLAYTMINMPPAPQSSITAPLGTLNAKSYVQSRVDEWTRQGQQAMTTYYVPGVGMSANSVPVLQGPQLPPAKASSPGPGPGPGPGPSVSTPGPGPSLATTNTSGLSGLTGTQASTTAASDAAAEKQYADQLQSEEQQAAQQQAQTTAQDQSSQQDQSAQSALQQLAQTGQQAAQQAAQTAQQSAQQDFSAAQQAAMAGMQTASSALNGLGGMDGGALSKLSRAGGLGSLASEEALEAESQASKLFPRAALSTAALESELAGTARAGMAAGGPAMGPGMAGGRSGGSEKEKEHKRPAYLESDEPLEEAFGVAPLVARPVVDE